MSLSFSRSPGLVDFFRIACKFLVLKLFRSVSAFSISYAKDEGSLATHPSQDLAHQAESVDSKAMKLELHRRTRLALSPG